MPFDAAIQCDFCTGIKSFHATMIFWIATSRGIGLTNDAPSFIAAFLAMTLFVNGIKINKCRASFENVVNQSV